MFQFVSSVPGARPRRAYRARQALSQGLLALERLSRQRDSADRALPAFLIIGAQKCGTSSLFDCLQQHPAVAAPLVKELHFFDLAFHRGERWYRAHFPRRSELPPNGQTFEASPYYLFHPAVPGRAKALLPDCRLIAMLRDPVERAYSHYWHEVNRGFEKLPIEQALDQEEERLSGTESSLTASTSARSHAHQHFSYLARGRYLEQLEAWQRHFPKEQMLILRSEGFFASPQDELERVCDFLGLPTDHGIDARPRNEGRYGDMPPSLRNRLESYFKPHNEALRRETGIRFGD